MSKAMGSIVTHNRYPIIACSETRLQLYGEVEDMPTLGVKAHAQHVVRIEDAVEFNGSHSSLYRWARRKSINPAGAPAPPTHRRRQPTHRLAVNCPVLALIVNFAAIAFVSLVRATIGRDDGGETLTETIPSLVTADLAHPLLSFF